MTGAESERLAAFERQLDPARPEAGGFGCRVIGYGEVSAVLVIDALPDRVLKRMSGFRSADEAERYAARVRRYAAALAGRGVALVPTEVCVVEGRAPVTYLLQPRLPASTLGPALLAAGEPAALHAAIAGVLDTVAGVLRANRAGGPELAIDAQLSNWAFDAPERPPRLLDLGSPLCRVDGRIEAETEPLYRAWPPPLRGWLRRRAVVERYFADYFDLRLVILDLVGNFVKEGAAACVGPGVAAANAWLARQPEREALAPIREEEVRRYYARDAALLELSLRVRRATRFVTTRLLGRRYDFVLPGPVRR